MVDTRTTRRPLVVASVMAAMFMVAIEATIVSTAMPQIVGQLGRLDLYAWVFSGYLLTQTATTVVFGKLADIYGRRPVLLAGIAIFLVGSVLCGLAWSMPSLILFRLIQGIGGGAVQPICVTIVGDLFSAEERGKVQGWLASVFGVSAVVGPLAGGLIIQNFTWAWIFWVNVPLGLLATVGFLLFLHEDTTRQARRIDVWGAAFFALSIGSLLVALTEIGVAGLAATLPAIAVFAVSTALFVRQERRGSEPMINIALWSRRPIAATNATLFFAGVVMIGLTSFLPVYVQGVLGRSPTVAGFTLTAMVIGWPIAATYSARAFMRHGIRRVMLAGSLLLPVGTGMLLFLQPDSSPWLAGAGSLVVGLGMGLLNTTGIVLVQESVAWGERGSATAAALFARNLGSTLGASLLGAVLNWGLSHAGAGGAATVSPEAVRNLLEGAGRVGAGFDPAVRAALDTSLLATFWAVFATAILSFFLTLAVPDLRVKRRAAPAPSG